MKEAFLQYLWRQKTIDFLHLKTTCGKPVKVLSWGVYNARQGPDFLDARLEIDGKIHAGAIEVHLKSSDWYAHRHETDPNYDNVILHLVWEDDVAVFAPGERPIPALEMKHYVSEELLQNYQRLATRKQFVNCETHMASHATSFFLKTNFKRLFIERLEHKAEDIRKRLQECSNDREEVLFQLLCKNFGSKVNGDAFLRLAMDIPHRIVRKCQGRFQIEALLFGQAGLLGGRQSDTYFLDLQKEYQFLKHKFQLPPPGAATVRFNGLRPINFPTIRLSQLAHLYEQRQSLFSEVSEADTIEGFYELMRCSASSYWSNHYVFDKESRTSSKNLSKSFINLLIINTFIPLRYVFDRLSGRDAPALLTAFMEGLPPEKNHLTDRFTSYGMAASSALESQALIHLYNHYCAQSRCLECAVGQRLLHGARAGGH